MSQVKASKTQSPGKTSSSSKVKPSPRAKEAPTNEMNAPKNPMAGEPSKPKVIAQPVSTGLRKPNYFKYKDCKEKMIHRLRTAKYPAKTIAKEARIATNSTFYKYQSILNKESDLLLLTKEEYDYFKKHKSVKEMAKIDTRIQEQNKFFEEFPYMKRQQQEQEEELKPKAQPELEPEPPTPSEPTTNQEPEHFLDQPFAHQENQTHEKTSPSVEEDLQETAQVNEPETDEIESEE